MSTAFSESKTENIAFLTRSAKEMENVSQAFHYRIKPGNPTAILTICVFSQIRSLFRELASPDLRRKTPVGELPPYIEVDALIPVLSRPNRLHA